MESRAHGKGQNSARNDNNDEERVSHPELAAIFQAWEHASVQFCAEHEESVSSVKQVSSADPAVQLLPRHWKCGVLSCVWNFAGQTCGAHR